MKNQIVLWIFLIGLVMTGFCQVGTAIPGEQPKIISEGLRFCESTYPYQGGLLIANFGCERLNPLNTEGKGYVAYYKNGKTVQMIPADGHLSAPKGMFERDGYLYVCDVNKIVVYNLRLPQQAPQIIPFPKDDLFLNDLAASGNTLYVSVTNTDRIYKIDISRPAAMQRKKPVKWLDVIGPNGLVVDGQAMYIASYPADGKTTGEHVIYYVDNLSRPVVQKFITAPGQYDGIALSPDKKTLYVSNWNPAGVSAIDTETREITPVIEGHGLVGPADMTLMGDILYIPDLPNSRVFILEVKR